MRRKDENKIEAIFQATIELLNEIGFSDISMSKIARRAEVSPSTIYVYFENKEDMLGKLYLNIKQKMSTRMFHGFRDTIPIRIGFETILRNYIYFILEHKDYFLFLEQFSNTPLVENLSLEDTGMFQPLFVLFEKGKNQHILKPIDSRMLLVLSYSPTAELAKMHYKGQFDFNEKNIDTVVQMSWDAIRA